MGYAIRTYIDRAQSPLKLSELPILWSFTGAARTDVAYRDKENYYARMFTVGIVCERPGNVIKLVEGRVYSEVFVAP